MARMRLHPLSNGKSHGWSNLRSFLDFFFPYKKWHPVRPGDRVKSAIFRRDTLTHVSSKTGRIDRHFYTFRAFALHYTYELFINPLRYAPSYAEELALRIGISPKLAFKIGAIAFDAKTHQTDGGGAQASRTISHTTTGSNRYMVVFVEGSNVADRITGATYNSVSMVQATNGGAGYKGDSGRYLNSFVLANPASGANNVVISSSPSDIIGASILSFTGAQQTNTPDSNNTATQLVGTTFTLTTTVVAANCWLVCFGHGNVNADGAGGTSRSETYADGYASEDSNGTVGTGSQSIAFGSLSANDSGLVISIAPAVSSLSITVNDAITLTESVSMTEEDNITVFDAITLTENIAMTEEDNVNVFDSVTITENLTVTNTSLGGISVNDAITLTESVTMDNLNLGDINVFDSITVSESVSMDLPFVINVFESVSVAESVTMDNANLGDVSVFEAITLTESVTMDNLNLGDISVFDLVTVSESLNLMMDMSISVQENISVSESVSVDNQLGDIFVVESISVSESVSVTVSAAPVGLVYMRRNGQNRPKTMDESGNPKMIQNQQNRPKTMDDSSVI